MILTVSMLFRQWEAADYSQLMKTNFTAAFETLQNNDTLIVPGQRCKHTNNESNSRNDVSPERDGDKTARHAA